LVADHALEHPVSDTRLGLHPNDLITCLTTRAGEIAGTITLHVYIMHAFAKCGRSNISQILIKGKASDLRTPRRTHSERGYRGMTILDTLPD
jgi:hypothetical protein